MTYATHTVDGDWTGEAGGGGRCACTLCLHCSTNPQTLPLAPCCVAGPSCWVAVLGPGLLGEATAAHPLTAMCLASSTLPADAALKLATDTMITQADPARLAAALETIRQQPGKVWPVWKASGGGGAERGVAGSQAQAEAIGRRKGACRQDELLACLQPCMSALSMARLASISAPHRRPCSLASCTPRMAMECGGCRSPALPPPATVSRTATRAGKRAAW